MLGDTQDFNNVYKETQAGSVVQVTVLLEYTEIFEQLDCQKDLKV